MRAVLDKVVMVGGRIAAFEKSILAKTEAKADDKVEQSDSSDESSAGEDQPKEAAMENVIFHGQKIGAWAAWSLQAWADVKEAHKEPIEVKATKEAAEESADGKAAHQKELTREDTYEQRVEAWVECFGNKAHGSRATKKTAKNKAAPTRVFSAKSPLRKI